MRVVLRLGDCSVRMTELPEDSVEAIICDPPYGLEFMGSAWDKLDIPKGDTNGFRRADNPADVGRDSVFGRASRTSPEYKTGASWQAGGGFSKPGIGERKTEWPSFSATSRYGTANPTCADCGGRLRGVKKCTCEQPHEHWKPIGKRRNPENEGLPDTVTGSGLARHMNAIEEWHVRWLTEAYRILEPGGMIKAFSGTRTFHRLASAMEQVGFEVMPPEAWGYGSGFPKSHNVSVAVDKMKGLERKVVGTKRGVKGADGTGHEKAMPGKAVGIKQVACDVPVTAPASPEAEAWEGWGTALKPAWEPAVVGRKPVGCNANPKGGSS